MKRVIPFLSLVFIFATYQNCSGDQVQFSEKSIPEATEISSNSGNSVGADGDLGTGGGDYECVSGQKLNIYIDPMATGVIEPANYLGAIVSYEGTDSAAVNYNYYSASAHPIVGPLPVGFEANVFFYDGSDGLALNFFSNVDAGGSTDNVVDMDIEVEGNSSDAEVLLSDDGKELKEVTENNFEGRFHYWNNTDGGVIGPFNKDDSFVIRVKFLSTGDVQSARFYSANSFHFSLSSTINPANSFIIANEDYLNCN